MTEIASFDTEAASLVSSSLGMKDENILCFSKDWNEDPTSNHHILQRLAQNNRVVWINSISTRTPNLSSGKDFRKIFRKLLQFTKGPVKVEKNLWVFTPVVVPYPHHPLAKKVNNALLRRFLGSLRRKLGMQDFQLWSFLPNTGDYFGTMGESLSVYYCVDEWKLFTHLDTSRTWEAEKALCQKADLVFATARSLVEDRRPFNPETHLATHGVDHALFAQALHEETPIPADLAGIPGPIIGFYGLLEDWLDYDLIVSLAERHPEWSFALLGKACVDVSHLQSHPNIHLLGRKPHGQLPRYCKAFSVGIIPYQLTERLHHVNPIKLREYLSAGLPVVSTPLPEVVQYQHLCSIAGTPEEFDRAILKALAEDSPERRQARSDAMRAETWEKKVEAIGEQVLRVKTKKRA
jgi:glycosyltransferase involved in cell wall biosynthesis